LSLLFLSTVPRAFAHGYLGKVTIDGTDYTGPAPQANPNAADSTSAIRQVADISPVKGASNNDLRCGLAAAAAASKEAGAKAGSVVEFWWTGGGGQEWPHNTGPLMTYMAACAGTSDCTTFDPSNAAWFKIDEIGQYPNRSGWWQAVFMSGQSLSVTLPNNLPTGHYLLRSEIIALHNAVSAGGAEFYPACAQLNVQGSGNTSPNPTVSFPGAYSDNDPGILVPDVYNDGFVYTFPGGSVSNLAAPADSTGSTSSLPFTPSSILAS
ncbi:glycoside hydrolase, partial [Vararia minispora EC-137]